jgi:hypothetical protein
MQERKGARPTEENKVGGEFVVHRKSSHEDNGEN